MASLVLRGSWALTRFLSSFFATRSASEKGEVGLNEACSADTILDRRKRTSSLDPPDPRAGACQLIGSNNAEVVVGAESVLIQTSFLGCAIRRPPRARSVAVRPD